MPKWTPRAWKLRTLCLAFAIISEQFAATLCSRPLSHCPCPPPDCHCQQTAGDANTPGIASGQTKWEHFARENGCHLGLYRRIEADLQRFKDPEDPSKRTISKALIGAAKGLPDVHICTIKDGKLYADTTWWGANQLENALSRVAQFLPDMEFVVNKMDEPRVLVGRTDDLDHRLASHECANASMEFRQFRHLHGSMNARNREPRRLPTRHLLPIFSQSKINECFADLTVPDWQAWNSLLKPEDQDNLLPWEKRNNTLFFRGSTTGGHYYADVNFTDSHRQRLVSFARGKPGMDMSFHAVAQCLTPEVCAAMEQYLSVEGTLQPRASQAEMFRYKFLMVIDGNTYIGRLPAYLSTGSLIFRAALYSQWFDEWLEPGKNYLSVKFDFSDLESKLEWAMQHDSQAQAIANAGKAFAYNRLRNEDIECYWGKLLLEYSALLQ